MKKFKFKLNSVLRYRKYKERLAQIEFIKARQAVFDKQKQLYILKENRKNTISELKKKENEGIDGAIYKIYTNYINGLEFKIINEKNELQKLQKIMHEKQIHVQNEQIKRKTLERMEELEKEKYIRWVLQTEQKIMDEMVGLKGNKKEL